MRRWPRSKAFFTRDVVFPNKGAQSVFHPMITEVMLDMIEAWDGTDESEQAILRGLVDSGEMCKIGDGQRPTPITMFENIYEAGTPRETRSFRPW